MSDSHLGERPHAFEEGMTEPDVLIPVIEKRYDDRQTGQQNLAIAIIENAVRDLRSSNARYKREAEAWLAGRVTDGVTFEACCEALETTPETIQKRLGATRSRATGYRSYQ